MWNPVAKVFVNGVEFTSDTLADVSITYGKKDITDNFRASVATVGLVSGASGVAIELNDKVEVTLQDSLLADVVVFTGRVMDISVDMLADDWVQTNLNLLSPIARLGHSLHHNPNVGNAIYSISWEVEVNNIASLRHTLLKPSVILFKPVSTIRGIGRLNKVGVGLFEYPPNEYLTPLQTLLPERLVIFNNIHRLLNSANFLKSDSQNIVSSRTHYALLKATIPLNATAPAVTIVAVVGLGKAPVTPVCV